MHVFFIGYCNQQSDSVINFHVHSYKYIFIRNCFRHGGFFEDSLEEIDQLPVLEDLSKRQHEEWICTDHYVEMAAVLSDDEVCVDILANKGKAENYDDDLSPIDMPPTQKEIIRALKVLRRII